MSSSNKQSTKSLKMATSPSVKAAEMRAEDVEEVSHGHRFSIQFDVEGSEPQKITRDFQTVLEAIKSVSQHTNLVIQGTLDGRDVTFATHFPCRLIKKGQKLIVSQKKYEIEKIQKPRGNRNEDPDKKYIFFYIDIEAGQNTNKKDIFVSERKQLQHPLCVYGEEGITAKEALEQDGRFKPFCSFGLTDCDDKETGFSDSTKIEDLSEKTFRIRLPKSSKPNRVESSKKDAAVSSSGANDEDSKQSPADSSQNELSMREENVSKAPVFTELIRMGKLVCKVVVGDVTGTGCVLIDNYILTSARLFKTCTDGDKVREGTEVGVQFNYENSQTRHSRPFTVEDVLICSPVGELDYAVLVVNREVFTQFTQKTQKGHVQIPSGLLERVGEMPKDGKVYIIGHPGGEVKQIELTTVIEIEKREQAVLDNLFQYRNTLDFLSLDQVQKQGIGRILPGGDRAEKVLTYRTDTNQDASGSPVCDADGSVCGLHKSCFVHGPDEAKEYDMGYYCAQSKESVIEYANSMKNIITHLVKKLREPNQDNLPGLLEKMEEAAGENDILTEIFDSL